MAELVLEVATGDPLSVRRFLVRESVSLPFEVTIVARTRDASLDLDAIVGRPAMFRAVGGVAGVAQSDRTWSGICRFVELEQSDASGLSTYRFVIVPTLWLMTQRRDHRIVQHQAAPEIAGRLLDTWGIPYERSLRELHPTLPYKVQYGETDYAFFCRILEEAGIAFRFAPEDTRAVVLGDHLQGGQRRSAAVSYVSSPNDAAEQEFVTDLRLRDDTRPGAHTIRDVDLRRPSYRLVGEATKAPAPEDVLEQYDYRPGAFLVETTTNTTGDTPVADADGGARHEEAEGKRRAQRSLDSERADKRAVTYRTNVLDLWPGRVFTIEGHPQAVLSQALLATDFSFEGAAGEEWTVRGQAVFTSQTYRPPLRTPRPRARVQSATVVGSGAIDPDELGRVRVHFPWDRLQQWSCWIRVSQSWAGAGYGMLTIPRVGQELLVDFLDGDPEQPVVVGRIFNRANPVVELLPANQTKSAWKSDSSPGSGGFNELLLEDKKGSELLYAQAEKDARRLVKHDDVSTIVQNRKKTTGDQELETTGRDRVQETRRDRTELTYGDKTDAVDGTRKDHAWRDAIERVEVEHQIYMGKDQHTLVEGTRRQSVEFHTHLHVGGGRPEAVGGTDQLGVHKALLETVGSYSVIASGPKSWIHKLAGSPQGGKIVIETDGEVTLRGDAGFITIDGGGVTIVGELVRINEGGAPAELPGVGPPSPEPPRMAVVDEPIPARDPRPDDPRVPYELSVVDEWEAPIVGLAFMVTTPGSTTAQVTGNDGRIRVEGPPEAATAYVRDPTDLAAILNGREKKARRATAVPTGDPWIVRTPTDVADTVVLPKNQPKKLMIVTRTDVTHHANGSLWKKRTLEDDGPYELKTNEPVLLQMQSDASAAQAVVLGQSEASPAPGGEAASSAEDLVPAAPGEGSAAPEWLRAVVDSLHDALFKGSFDVVFSILASIPLDPPRSAEPPAAALRDP